MNNIHLKTGLTYGIITSILSTCIGLALHFTGLATYSGSGSGWSSTLIVVLGVYLASEAFKKNNEGFLSHKDLIITCLWMGLFSGIVSGIFGYLQATLDPSIFEMQLNRMEVEMETKGLSDQQIEQTMEISRKMFQPVPLAFIVLVSVFITLFVIGAIMGFFLKKERPIFDSMDDNL